MMPVANGGLSPRVRGNRHGHVVCSSPPGSIPACAGEPCARRAGRPALRVYPRVCGGTDQYGLTLALAWGLSPRVRGNLHRRAAGEGQEGSIPACAGEPATARSALERFRVYPRVCGGTKIRLSRSPRLSGLSPRVRGNPVRGEGDAVRIGSIPACAGEPRSRPSRGSPAGVYPRVCGGTAVPVLRPHSTRGLSPRVRGNRRELGSRRPRRRSIPACAGEPKGAWLAPPEKKVYPRVCGGTIPNLYSTVPGVGLSPRVRGNHRGGRQGRGPQGSIPACAGEPHGGSPGAVRGRVYPRVCGGTASSGFSTKPL